MNRLRSIEELNNKILILETRVKHLTNELHLTKEEYENTVENYFELYSNMEKRVAERTKELKKLQKIIEVKSKQLQIMIDSSPAMIFYKDAEQKYIRVNKKFSKTHGIPIKKIIGKTYTDLFQNSTTHIFHDDHEIIQKGKPLFKRPGHIDTPNGRREITVDKVPYKDIDGNVIGIIGFALDVTDLKRAETEKRNLQQRISRAEKMEAIGLLAGGVAHDGNNILTGIIGYLQLLLMKLPGDDPNRKYIEGSLEAANQMERLINDLLTLTRSVAANKEIVNLNDVIIDYLGSPTHKKLESSYQNISIVTDLETDLLNIRGIEANLTKTVMNLVTNAVEALPDGGNIIISTRNTYVDQLINAYDLRIQEGDYVVLSVSDNGSGIAPEDINRIFEPFFTKKKTGKSGTGLGMAVVYGTLKDHGGYIDVKSTVSAGTTFELYFPVTRDQILKDKTTVPLDELIGNKEKVVIVDDLKPQREILSEILTRLNYSVVAFASGEESVDHMKTNSADLVILDMIMEPGIDGLETYRRILELHPKQKAIIASGYSKTERVDEAQKLGAGQFIKKPYTIEKIGLVVKAELTKFSSD